MLSSLGFNLLVLMFFPPVGILSVWLFTEIEVKYKLILTILVVLIMLVKKVSNDIFTILMLIFFPPMGLLSMWILTKWGTFIKVVLTIFMSTYVIMIFNQIMQLINLN